MWKYKNEKRKNSADSLDEKTCDTVMQDLSMCIDDWDQTRPRYYKQL